MILTFLVLLLLSNGLIVRPDTSIIYSCVGLITAFYPKNIYVECDTPEPWGLFFQDNTTPQMEGLEELHNNIMFYLAIVLFTVAWTATSIILAYRWPIYGWNILSNLRTTYRAEPVDTDDPNKVIEITLVQCTGLNRDCLPHDQAYRNNSRCYDIGFQTLVNGEIDLAAAYAVSRSLRFSSSADDYYNHGVVRLFKPTPWNLSVFNDLHVERDAGGYYSYIPLPVHILLIPGHVVKSNGQPVMDHNVVLDQNRFSAKVYHTTHHFDRFNAKIYHAQSDVGPYGLYSNLSKKRRKY